MALKQRFIKQPRNIKQNVWYTPIIYPVTGLPPSLRGGDHVIVAESRDIDVTVGRPGGHGLSAQRTQRPNSSDKRRNRNLLVYTPCPEKSLHFFSE